MPKIKQLMLGSWSRRRCRRVLTALVCVICVVVWSGLMTSDFVHIIDSRSDRIWVTLEFNSLLKNAEESRLLHLEEVETLRMRIRNNTKMSDLEIETTSIARLNGYHRTGNHIFMLASLLHVSRITGRIIVMPRKNWLLDQTFDLPSTPSSSTSVLTSAWVARVKNIKTLCPCEKIDTPHYSYDWRLKNVTYLTRLRTRGARTLRLCGLSQTVRYAEDVDEELRGLLRFRSDVLKTARSFLTEARRRWKGAGVEGGEDGVEGGRGMGTSEANRSAGARGGVESGRAQTGGSKRTVADVGVLSGGTETADVRQIGVHIRRGDFIKQSKFGLETITAGYLRRAFQYFTERFARVQFVIETLDWDWTNANLPPNLSADIVRSVNHSASEDLAILSLCDGVIVSTGTFGYWGAWLANKTTVYYAKWARRGSPLYKLADRNGYFRADWIGLS